MFKKIDHIAIAVRDLDLAIDLFQNTLGFELVRRLDINGKNTGMLSAEMSLNNITFVLCQGKTPESQVSRLISEYGVGVAHIALSVNHIDDAVADLDQRGMRFDTSLIKGQGLSQIFSTRDSNSGLSFELIERHGEQGFLESNVSELFAQLESSHAY
jgi:methylmalonyl-CoA/ethylmalonyl-CoA epimerase